MSAFVRGTCVFAIAGIAAVLSGRTFAQSDSPAAPAVDAPQAAVTNAAQDAEEVTVRGRRKTLGDYRVELQEAKEELIAVYNEQNSGTSNDVTCRNERATGTKMRQRVCRSNAQTSAESAASREWLRTLVFGQRSTSGPSRAAAGAAAGATADAVAASSRSSSEIEKELEQLARENRTLYRAVVEYIEAEDTYLKARDEITARGESE